MFNLVNRDSAEKNFTFYMGSTYEWQDNKNIRDLSKSGCSSNCSPLNQSQKDRFVIRNNPLLGY